MITLNGGNVPPEAIIDPVKIFLALAEAFSRPGKVKAEAEDLLAAVTEFVEQKKALAAERSALAEAKSDKAAHDKRLQEEREAHVSALEASRKAWEIEKQKSNDGIRRAESEVQERLEAARKHESAAKQVRENIEYRLEKIRSAAA
jgi:hypothetical protein